MSTDERGLPAELVISPDEAEQPLTTEADLAGTTATRKAEIADLRTGMSTMKPETMKPEIIEWNLGTILAPVGSAVAIVELIGPRPS